MTMYAIVRQGSHQYRVAPGDVIQIEKIDAEKGQEVQLDDVLMLSDGEMTEIGSPRIDNAAVKAKVLRNDRGPKIIVFKFKRRKGYMKRQGHRQSFTELKITGFVKDGQELAAE